MSLVNYVIGITGGSGSGKTSIVKAIRALFSKEELCIISQDNYYVPREQQAIDGNGIRNFDLPTSLDLDLFTADVLRLINGESLELEEYVFNNSMSESQMILYKPAPVLLLEGLFVYHQKKLRDLFDCKIFVDAPEDTKLNRRISRDKVERNYPLEDVLYRFENHVTPSFDKYILPHKQNCDIIIDNSKNYDKGIDILSSLIKSKLLD